MTENLTDKEKRELFKRIEIRTMRKDIERIRSGEFEKRRKSILSFSPPPKKKASIEKEVSPKTISQKSSSPQPLEEKNKFPKPSSTKHIGDKTLKEKSSFRLEKPIQPPTVSTEKENIKNSSLAEKGSKKTSPPSVAFSSFNKDTLQKIKKRLENKNFENKKKTNHS